MQQLTDQSVGQRIGDPGQYLDIALVAGWYLDIYCPAMAFDVPTQGGAYYYNNQKRFICSLTGPSFKCLDMRTMPMHIIPIFITEVLRLVTYVQLF